MRIAMVRIHEHLERAGMLEDVRLLLQVHDELLFEMRQPLIERVVPELSAIMEAAFPAADAHGVPIVVEAKMGKNWGALEKR